MKKLLLATLLFVCTQAFAQKSPEQMGGVYYAYPIETGTDKPQLQSAPAGYEPFYISHYGRHGSRWLTNDARYQWVNKHFDDDKNLTKLGKSVTSRHSTQNVSELPPAVYKRCTPDCPQQYRKQMQGEYGELCG